MESLDLLIKDDKVKSALEFIRQDDENTLKEHLEMCEIPAPTFMEEDRGNYVLEKFKTIGLSDVHKDEVGNVLGVIKGTGNGPRVMLAAHLDTVFSIETDVKIRFNGGKYRCPGINDDTRALAELLTIARAMIKNDLRGMGDIVFCANVCEEGLGDLKGVKHIFGKTAHGIDAFVSIDNQVTGGVVYTATGSLRYEVIFNGPGGHSFKDFGIANPIHAMGRAIAKIAEIRVLDNVKTTFNVGVVSGGTSVNTISQSASMLIDIRSDDWNELLKLKAQIMQAIDEAVAEENKRWDVTKEDEKISVEIICKGERPAGTQKPDCNMVKTAFNVAEILGIAPELRYESSTDANIPISLGIPAITVGRGGREGKMHTLDEWFVPEEAWLGPQRDLLLILALSGVENVIKSTLHN